MKPSNQVAADLIAILEVLGLSKTRIAADLGVSASMLTLWARGRRAITPERIDTLFNTSLALLAQTGHRAAETGDPTALKAMQSVEDLLDRMRLRAEKSYWDSWNHQLKATAAIPRLLEELKNGTRPRPQVRKELAKISADLHQYTVLSESLDQLQSYLAALIDDLRNWQKEIKEIRFAKTNDIGSLSA